MGLGRLRHLLAELGELLGGLDLAAQVGGLALREALELLVGSSRLLLEALDLRAPLLVLLGLPLDLPGVPLQEGVKVLELRLPPLDRGLVHLDGELHPLHLAVGLDGVRDELSDALDFLERLLAVDLHLDFDVKPLRRHGALEILHDPVAVDLRVDRDRSLAELAGQVADDLLRVESEQAGAVTLAAGGAAELGLELDLGAVCLVLEPLAHVADLAAEVALVRVEGRVELDAVGRLQQVDVRLGDELVYLRPELLLVQLDVHLEGDVLQLAELLLGAEGESASVGKDPDTNLADLICHEISPPVVPPWRKGLSGVGRG